RSGQDPAGQLIDLKSGNRHLQSQRSQAGDDVVLEETFGPPYRFNGAPKKKHGVHIEKNMKEAAVHKHVSNGLPNPEQLGFKIMRAKDMQHESFVRGECGQEKQAVDN